MPAKLLVGRARGTRVPIALHLEIPILHPPSDANSADSFRLVATNTKLDSLAPTSFRCTLAEAGEDGGGGRGSRKRARCRDKEKRWHPHGAAGADRRWRHHP